jgi:MFS family permease
MSSRALVFDLARGAIHAHLEQGVGMPPNRSAIKRGLLVATLVSIIVSAGIVLSNVVFPSPTDDDTVMVVGSYLGIFAALLFIGVLADRAGAGRRGLVLAGLIAGFVIGLVTIATFVVVDNVWLDIVSRQQSKIEGFASSGETSMRAYINHGLIGPGVFFTVVFSGLGAVLSLIGGLINHRPEHRPDGGLVT